MVPIWLSQAQAVDTKVNRDAAVLRSLRLLIARVSPRVVATEEQPLGWYFVAIMMLPDLLPISNVEITSQLRYAKLPLPNLLTFTVVLTPPPAWLWLSHSTSPEITWPDVPATCPETLRPPWSCSLGRDEQHLPVTGDKRVQLKTSRKLWSLEKKEYHS